MASRAGAGLHAIVIIGRWLPRVGLVAGIATILSREVTCSLTLRGLAVMAVTARSRRDSRMVKSCRLPCRRPVADITTCFRRYVAGGLSGRCSTIVTGLAGARRNCAMTKSCLRPDCRGVAGVTVSPRGNMIGGGSHRTHPVTGYMAGRTLARCSLENPVCMAGFAFCLAMRTRKRETRCQMVKVK